MSEKLIEKRTEEFNEKQKLVFNNVRIALIGLSYKQAEQILFTLLESIKFGSVVNDSTVETLD